MSLRSQRRLQAGFREIQHGEQDYIIQPQAMKDASLENIKLQTSTPSLGKNIFLISPLWLDSQGNERKDIDIKRFKQALSHANSHMKSFPSTAQLDALTIWINVKRIMKVLSDLEQPDVISSFSSSTLHILLCYEIVIREVQLANGGQVKRRVGKGVQKHATEVHNLKPLFLYASALAAAAAAAAALFHLLNHRLLLHLQHR
ncbi:hypothetical protein AHAS_Ahas13G0219100 [Arachis hypogaea]